MKHECPTYFKSIRKSKALAATLSDTEPKDDSNNEDNGILNAFTATVNSTERIVEDVDEEKVLVESKFEKMDDYDDIHTAYEKLYRLATKKLSDVELDCEKLSTKFDEANQTIGALRFENNFLAEKTKKLKVELFQVRAQLERTSSAKLATTLSDTEHEDDSDNKDDGILNAFTATVNSIEGIVEDVDEEEELVESKFEKMDDNDDIHTTYEKLYKFSKKHEKLYRLATKKLSDVELDREELFTKFDEANQTIGALRFENNFLAEKTKKFEAELFQVRTQLERTSSVKLDEMLSI